MIARVLLAALIAGLLAGAVVSAVQLWRVTPLILAAETFETSEGGEEAATEEAAEEEAWMPADGIERAVYTVGANLIVGVGFALVLAAAVMFSGRDITPTNGVVWGLLGFIVFTLAPTAGLAPELPGMPAGDLGQRQVWWWGTVVATGGGIALLTLQGNMILKGLGVVLIALPHLIGAPHPSSPESAVPAVLAAEFAARSVASMAVFWIVLGVAFGWALGQSRDAAEA